MERSNRVEELKDVKGIGAKRFEKLKGELTVGASPKPAGASSRKKRAARRNARQRAT
jgi:hypothetical protein